MIEVRIENLTTGLGYTYMAKSQKQANAWVNWIQISDLITELNCPNCKCHLRITVGELKS